MVAAIFVILVAQFVQVPYKLIVSYVQITRLHSEYLIKINAFVKINTLMTTKIKYANHVHRLVILVKTHKIFVYYAKVDKIEYFRAISVYVYQDILNQEV